MSDLDGYVSAQIQAHLTAEERDYLSAIFERFGGYPSLEQVWQLMDEPWDALGCDPNQMDDRITSYYRHPVWTLNGLFIEQDPESLTYRRAFKDWIVQQAPTRVADFGGGFGGLARLVGEALPLAQIEVVEPHPRPAAVVMASQTPNVRFVSALTGEYDLLIATDVFEHVPDPLGLCAETAANLKVGGQYLIANCFHPVIKCHLPQLFHFSYGWDAAMQAMGLIPSARVSYGRVYSRSDPIDLFSARTVGERARNFYPLVRCFPRGQARIGALVLKIFGKLA